MSTKKRFRIRIVASRRLNSVQDGITLPDRKRRNAQCIAGRFTRMSNDGFRNGAGFFRIGAGAPCIKPSFDAAQ